MKTAYVYIMASQRNGTLYIGVTTDLEGRVWEHQNKIFGGFTAKYNVNKLVYYEEYDCIVEAINREKSLKDWTRKRKLTLIEEENPKWIDLSAEWG